MIFKRESSSGALKKYKYKYKHKYNYKYKHKHKYNWYSRSNMLSNRAMGNGHWNVEQKLITLKVLSFFISFMRKWRNLHWDSHTWSNKNKNYFFHIFVQIVVKSWNDRFLWLQKFLQLHFCRGIFWKLSNQICLSVCRKGLMWLSDYKW